MEILLSLFQMESKTLLGILIWGNLAFALLVFTYQGFVKNIMNKDTLIHMAQVRVLYAIGYLFVLDRNVLPDIISVNIANVILYICMFLDLTLIMKMIGILSLKIKIVMTVILICSMIAFNILEVIYSSSSMRIAVASVIIFSLYLVPTLSIVFMKNIGNFCRSIGFIYVVLLFTLVVRFTESLEDTNLHILSNNIYQSIFFLVQIIIMNSSVIIQLLLLKEDNDKMLERLATTDHLTGLPNRHDFMTQAEWVFSNCQKTSAAITILFFDLDMFKSTNDTYGHQFGDEVLIAFAGVLKNSLRQSDDLFCRYGGEEFIVLLSHCPEYGQKIAQRITDKLKTLTFETVPDYTFTTSIGLYSAVPKKQDTLSGFINYADIALFTAKQTGRNKLVIYSEEMTMGNG